MKNIKIFFINRFYNFLLFSTAILFYFYLTGCSTPVPMSSIQCFNSHFILGTDIDSMKIELKGMINQYNILPPVRGSYYYKRTISKEKLNDKEIIETLLLFFNKSDKLIGIEFISSIGFGIKDDDEKKDFIQIVSQKYFQCVDENILFSQNFYKIDFKNHWEVFSIDTKPFDISTIKYSAHLK